MPKMTDETFRSVIDAEVTQAAAWTNTVMADDLERNLSYYHGQPLGNEVDGRSQVVSWDVFEVCESALPSLIEPFFSGDEIGEFEPVGPEDEAYCEQATEYVNHLVKKKNEGFLLFNTWIKDGLLSKIGIARVWWDKREKIKKESYTGLTDEQMIRYMDDPRYTITAHAESPDPDDEKHRKDAQSKLATLPPEQAAQVQQMLDQPPQMLHDIDVTVMSGPNGTCINNVPPETFILSRKAKRLEESTIIGEQRRYTRSDLVEMGFDRARVDELSDYDFTNTPGELSTARDPEGSNDVSDPADRALQEVQLFYGFIRVDYDGDGIAEWRRVFMGGNDVLENEEVDDHEYCIWSPILLPHRVIGMAYADPLIEIQNLKTTLTRQYLDSLYAANNPATQAVDGKVNLDDLLSSRINKVVRVKELGMVAPLQTTLVANEALQGIELADTMRENRLGVTKYNQGLDANSLNKTAHGVERIMTAAEKRLLMTLRIFAETGVKDLFKKVLRLICMYQDKPATVRMRNQWVDFDPRGWSSEMDVTVDVGLGNADNQQMLMHLQMIGGWMEKVMPLGLVREANMYNFGKMLLKNAKIQGGIELLLTDPATAEPMSPKKSPEQVLAETELQLEQMRQQGKAQETAQKMQMDDKRLAIETTLKGLDLQLKEKEIRIKEIDLGLKARQQDRDAMMGNAQFERDGQQALQGAEGQPDDQRSQEQPQIDQAQLIEGILALQQGMQQLAQLIVAPRVRHLVRDEQGKPQSAVEQIVLNDQQPTE